MTEQSTNIPSPELKKTFKDVPYPLITGNAASKQFFAEHAIDYTKPHTKQELIDMGYVMANRVGDGQVPIIKKIGEEDTSGDALLTHEQLRAHILETLPEGIELSELAEIEADMNTFIHEVQILTMVADLFDTEGRRGNPSMQNYTTGFLHDISEAHPDWDVIAKVKEHDFFDWYVRQPLITEAMLRVKAQYQIPDHVRGIPISMLDRRGEGRGVHGYACPCMECDHVFPRTDGIKIYDDGSVTGVPGQVRMNVVTTHLAGHGINNNENQTVDRDHRYMTLDSYLKIYAKRGMDKEGPNILELDYRKIEQQILMAVLRATAEKLGFSDQLSDQELRSMVNEMLFIKED